MRKILSAIALLLCFITVNAQDEAIGSYDVVGYSDKMKDLWININDSLTPYLTQKMRKEMVELKELGVSGDVTNVLDGISVLDTITNDYMKVQLSKAKCMEIKRLPVDSGYNIICLVTTYYVPEPQSSVEFYNCQWKKLNTEEFIDAPYSIKSLMNKPASMSNERFEELTKLIEFDMVGINLSIDKYELVITPSFSLLSKDDKKALEEVIPERKLIWNGKTFKICYN